MRQVVLALCEDYPEESRSLDGARRDFELMAKAGIRTLRISIGWDGVEPEEDRYDFSFWDAFIDMAVNEFGLTLIPYVAYTPDWNSDGGPTDFWKTPPRDLAEFGEIVGLLAARYRDHIRSWEIWNEPDNRDYWLGSAEQYAELLRVGARAVREHAPEARVVSGGLAGNVEFLAELFEHDVADSIDVVNLHSYFETWNPEPLETLPKYVGEVERLVRKHDPTADLWMAEVGYSNYRRGTAVSPLVSARFDYEHTLRFQAVMLVRTVALLFDSPAISLVAWYEVKDPPASDVMIGDDNNRHLGVLFHDHRPKPALSALRTMNLLFGRRFERLGDAITVERSETSGSVVRAFLTNEGRAVVIAWLENRERAAPRTEANAGLEVDTRTERVRVTLPFRAVGEAVAFDAVGERVPPPLALDSAHGVTLALDLYGGDVAIVEVPVARP